MIKEIPHLVFSPLRTLAHMHTRTLFYTHCHLHLFYLPYSTCFRQSAPTPFKWILSQPFTFSLGDVLMKGDGTIWSDQVAQSTAQLSMLGHGETKEKACTSSLINPLPFSLTHIPTHTHIHTLWCFAYQEHLCEERECVFICLHWLSTYQIVYDVTN